MPAISEVLSGNLDKQVHTFPGYRVWSYPPLFGDNSNKETNPAWKYQTTGSIMLLGCTIFANGTVLAFPESYDRGPTRLDAVHEFSIHFLGIVLSILGIFVEVEHVQLLDTYNLMRNWLYRGIFYVLLAAVTFESLKTFYYYRYTTYICSGLLTNAAVYVFFHFYFACRRLVKKRRPEQYLAETSL